VSALVLKRSAFFCGNKLSALFFFHFIYSVRVSPSVLPITLLIALKKASAPAPPKNTGMFWSPIKGLVLPKESLC
jgi:hypothetical protein